MFRHLRNIPRLGALLFVVLVLFGGIYFSKKVGAVRELAHTIELQTEEITGLKSSIERIETLKSLQVDLRLKLFGNQEGAGASGGSTRAAYHGISGDLLALARRSNVEFASFDPSTGGMTIRFWGRYTDVTRFLSLAESSFPRIDHVLIETSKNGGVLLSLTVPATRS